MKNIKRYLVAITVAVLTACGGGGGGGGPTNTPPVANAGPASTVGIGTAVQLDGSRSSDANGDKLQYSWTISSKPAGSLAVLTSEKTASPTFVADVAGVYTLALVVNDGKSDSTGATVTVTASGPQLGVAGKVDRTKSGWVVTTSKSALTGEVSTFLIKQGLGGVFYNTLVGTFVIQCLNNKVNGYHLQTEDITASGAVSYRIGTESPVIESWIEGSGFKTLVRSSVDSNFLRKIFLNSELYLEYGKYGGGSGGGVYRVGGFPAAVDETREACGWSTATFPPSNGWGQAYPTEAPSTAKEGVYSATAFSFNESANATGNYFRVLAWKANNASGKPQLLVRVGDFSGPCVGSGTNGSRENSFYVVQGGKTIPAVRGTSYIGTCKQPEIYALNGDYDVTKPFSLEVYSFHEIDISRGSPFTTINFD
jgi:hypothetical protein